MLPRFCVRNKFCRSNNGSDTIPVGLGGSNGRVRVRMKMAKLASKEFGRLIALEPTNRRINGGVVWKCRCSCGNIAFVLSSRLTNGTTRSCGCITKDRVKEMGHKFIGPANPAWKDLPRRYIESDGYVRVFVPGRGRVREHRYIIEKEFGRKLTKGEIVHHLNGIRWDNRRENLKYFSNHRDHRLHHVLIEKIMIIIMRRIVYEVLTEEAGDGTKEME